VGKGGCVVLLDNLSGADRGSEQGSTVLLQTKDGRVQFVRQGEERFALVKVPVDFPVRYPLRRTTFSKPAKAVLMDLDGTTVLSEHYWIDAIRETVARVLGDSSFRFSSADLPYVSGYSTREHLAYCQGKYDLPASLDELKDVHKIVVEERLAQLAESDGAALEPGPGLKEFLIALKQAGVRLGIVTSAAQRKAMLELDLVFRKLDLGPPEQFYDVIITAGTYGATGTASTLGGLASKPHPWLYLEAARVGLGLGEEEWQHVVCIEDSTAGVIAAHLAGFAVLGLNTGSLAQSGVESLLLGQGDSLLDFLPLLI